MKFLDYTMTMRGLETVAERFDGEAPRTSTDLRKDTVAAARERALDAEARAGEAEVALAAARKAVDEQRATNDAERERLRQEAHDAREAALDAPTRRRALEQDAIVERIKGRITELDNADFDAAATIEPLELQALARRKHAHDRRARALRVLRDAAFADVQIAIWTELERAAAIEREFKARGLPIAEYGD